MNSNDIVHLGEVSGAGLFVVAAVAFAIPRSLRAGRARKAAKRLAAARAFEEAQLAPHLVALASLGESVEKIASSTADKLIGIASQEDQIGEEPSPAVFNGAARRSEGEGSPATTAPTAPVIAFPREQRQAVTVTDPPVPPASPSVAARNGRTVAPGSATEEMVQASGSGSVEELVVPQLSAGQGETRVRQDAELLANGLGDGLGFVAGDGEFDDILANPQPSHNPARPAQSQSREVAPVRGSIAESPANGRPVVDTAIVVPWVEAIDAERALNVAARLRLVDQLISTGTTKSVSIAAFATSSDPASAVRVAALDALVALCSDEAEFSPIGRAAAESLRHVPEATDEDRLAVDRAFEALGAG